MVNSDFLFSLEYNMKKYEMKRAYERHLNNSNNLYRRKIIPERKNKLFLDHYLENLLQGYLDANTIRKYVKEEYTFLKVYNAELKLSPDKKKFFRISLPLEFNDSKKKRK